MRTFKKLFVAAATLFAATMTMAQNGFNYQAVIRDANGNLLAEQQIALRITLTTANGNEVYYKEMHKPVSTNAYGVVSIVVGNGTVLSGYFSKVPWNSGEVYMKTEFDPTGVGTDDLLVTIGTTKLQSVPVAEYAKKTGEVENPKNIKIQATNETGDEEALFEVKDNDGKVVFAVYKNGVRVYVDENDAKAAKSGFAVAGKSGKDGTESQYFSVNASGTKVYVDDDTVTTGGKAAKAKFAVAGKSGKANANTDYFAVNGYGTQIYVDDTASGKAAKAKFAVAGKSGKGDGNLLVVNEAGTKVYVDDGDTKAAKAKFAVAGRSGKAGGNSNFFAIDGNGTQVFVDDTASGKAAKAKFAVAGKSGKADGNLLVVNEAGTKVYVDDGDTKAAKAKFAVAGRSGKAGENANFFAIDDNGTQVFVDDTASGKAAKAKFAVAGKSGKADDNLLVVNEAGTKVYVDDDGTKAAKAKFAVAGKSGGKANNTNPNYLTIDNESTRIYIDETPTGGKAAKSGFAVAGKSGGKTGSDELFNIDLDTAAQVLNGVNRIYWYPNKNAFMAGNLKVEHADSVGTNSFNAGYQNKAIGEYSQALGYQSRAKGDYTTAIGKNANADKDNAYAFGNNAQAIGTGSYAIGADAEAKGTSSIALGSTGQDSLGNILPSAKATADFSYSIGAGTESSAKGALSIGVGAAASGEYSTAMGYMSFASGIGSIAIGNGRKYRYKHNDWIDSTRANGFYATAIGHSARAYGDYSTAIGSRVYAGEEYSFAAGRDAVARAQSSIAIGYDSETKGVGSVAIGYVPRTVGDFSVSLGYHNQAIHKSTIAIGHNLVTCSYGEIVLGSQNTIKNFANENSTQWNGNDRLLVIGNAAPNYSTNTTPSSMTRSDALVIYKNGNMTVNGTLTHSGLVEASDIRLKKDIQTLNGALDKVLKLRGVSFYWKSKEEMAAARGKDVNNFSYGFGSEKQIGVIAQEIEQVLPELVVTDKDGFKAVKYENLTPVLIEAVKELKAEKDALEATVANQQKENEAMKKEMAEMKKMLEELMKK